MASLTFYGAVDEIGGNKILLESGKSRVFMDFGVSFSRHFRYFDYLLLPRKLNGMGDFLELGLLPELDGIYREDYLAHSGKPKETRKFNGVFLTHAHADHCAHMHFLRQDMPVYASRETFAILDSAQETGKQGWNEFINLRKTFEFCKNYKGKYERLPWALAGKGRDLRTIDSPAEFDSIRISSSKVNHSLPGAVGYLIETQGPSIAYTGDLRFHGYSGQDTEEFVRKAAGSDILIIEGTRINEKGTISEQELKERLSQAIRGTQGLVLANWPIRDTDRMLSFYEAAKENGRILAINTKQANLLEKLEKCGTEPGNLSFPKLTDKNIRIFLTRKYWGLIDKENLPDKSLRESDYSSWERKYLNHPNMVDYREIRDNPGDYAVRCDFYDMTELIDLKPDENSRYIRSTCEPFDDKMEFNERIVDAWLAHYGIRKSETLHCSGHAPGSDIKRIIDEIGPKTVIPVHTEHSHEFEQLCKRVVYPKTGEKTDF